MSVVNQTSRYTALQPTGCSICPTSRHSTTRFGINALSNLAQIRHARRGSIRYQFCVKKSGLVWMTRSLFILMFALSAMGFPAHRVFSQGANHEGGHSGDGIRCSSGKPDIAIIACTNIIEDKHESDVNHGDGLGAVHQNGCDTS